MIFRCPTILLAAACSLAPAQPFRITITDSATGRGIPLVECTTVNGITHITDSAGVIAFDEPGLMNRDVFFTITSHGYTHKKDGFGYTGTRLRTVPGGAATVTIDRTNIAERLYRITGGGIYRDSVILGDTPPTTEPLLAGDVLGQDSVQTAIYRGTLRWFWGDTNRVSYPLGNFSTSGAVSDLPANGGLDPAIGINLTYFTGRDGFSRPMCPIEGQPGPVWIDGLVVCNDSSGRERLLCRFARIKTLGELYEQGFAQYNDDKDLFEPIRRFPIDQPLYMHSHPVRHKDADGDYWYFPAPFPLVRCRADCDSLLNPAAYEAYTCLKPGARYNADRPELDRDPSGKLIYSWKPDTGLILQREQNELISKGQIKPEEAFIKLRDPATGKPIIANAGTVYWNDYLQRWIMLAQEVWGSSMCGEIWFSCAPAITGPWEHAIKVVSHNDYSFYNVAQHPYFDQDRGRIIYFEGTYTMTFSGTKTPTPRYDYNQIMYRLDLSDPRLSFRARQP